MTLYYVFHCQHISRYIMHCLIRFSDDEISLGSDQSVHYKKAILNENRLITQFFLNMNAARKAMMVAVKKEIILPVKPLS